MVLRSIDEKVDHILPLEVEEKLLDSEVPYVK